MRDWLFLLAVPLLVFITSLFMKWVDRKLETHDRIRKEKKEREEKLDTSSLELQKTKEEKEIGILRLTLERNKDLEISRDEASKRIEQILEQDIERLHKEVDRLNKENHHLRDTLTSAMLGFKLIEKGGSPEQVIRLGGRLAEQILDASKDGE